MPPMTDAADRHAQAVATVRGFAAAAGALRVVLLLDRGEDRDALMVDCDAAGTVEVTDGDEIWEVPAGAAVPAVPHPLPHVHPVPATAIEADPVTGELSGPIGAVPLLAGAVRELVRTFGGRSVVTAEFATRDPELPITIAAREGEPLLLAVGDERFELPEGA